MLHILDGGAEDEKQRRIYPPSRQGISFLDFLMIILCRGIGAGLLRLGPAFQSGALLSLLILAYTGILSWISVQITIRIYAKTKANSYEEAWKVLFGPKYVFIMTFLSTVSTISVLCSYLNLIISSIQAFFTSITGNMPWYVMDSLSMAIFLALVFYIPLCYSSSVKTLVNFAYIKMSLAVLLMIYIIYMFIKIVVNEGFNTEGQLVLFRFDSHAVTTIGSFADAYLVLPLSYPGTRNLIGSNIASLQKVFTLAMVIFFVVYSTIGEISYFTFFDNNRGGVILNYYPMAVVNQMATLGLAIMLLLTSSLPFNTCRYLLITLGTHIELIPMQMWTSIGILILVFFCIAAALSSIMLTYIGYVSMVSSVLYLFILPPIFYKKAFGIIPQWYYAVGIVLIASGLGSIAVSIYSSL